MPEDCDLALLLDYRLHRQKEHDEVDEEGAASGRLEVAVHKIEVPVILSAPNQLFVLRVNLRELWKLPEKYLLLVRQQVYLILDQILLLELLLHFVSLREFLVLHLYSFQIHQLGELFLEGFRAQVDRLHALALEEVFVAELAAAYEVNELVHRLENLKIADLLAIVVEELVLIRDILQVPVVTYGHEKLLDLHGCGIPERLLIEFIVHRIGILLL